MNYLKTLKKFASIIVFCLMLWLVAGCAKPLLKIAHISDLHVVSDTSYLEKVIAKINKKTPDLVLVSGDLTQNGTDKEYYKVLKTLDLVDSPLFFVNGNHDYYTKNRSKTNFAIEINGLLWIMGIDPGFGRNWKKANWNTSTIDSLLNIVPVGSDIILLTHYPIKGEKSLNEIDSLFNNYNLVMAASGHYHANTELYENGILYSTVSPANDWRKNHDKTNHRGYKWIILTKFIDVSN